MKLSIVLIAAAVLASGCDTADPGGAYYDNTVAWNRISGRIALAVGSSDAKPGYDLLVLDGDQLEVRHLVNADDIWFPAGLSWHPNGITLAFGAYTRFDGQGFSKHQVFTTRDDASGSYVNHAYDSGAHHGNPAWSPDGRLAWVHCCPREIGQSTGRSVRIDGRSYIVGNAAFRSSPAWVPDGTYLIVSVEDETSQGALYRLDPELGGLQPVLQGTGVYNSEIFGDPEFSPDGSRVVYWRRDAAVQELWTMAPDGTDLRRLTTGFQDLEPAWSPHGTQIAFIRGDLPYVMRSDGSDVVKLRDRRADAIAWGPSAPTGG